MKYRAYFILLISLSAVGVALAQEVDVNVSSGNSKRQRADSLFEKQDFVAAIALYNDLLEEYPRDANLQYSLGVSYLLGTRRMDLAVSYLTQASHAEINNKVYFYLAEALRISYRFNEAIDYYRRFTVSGGSNDVKNDGIEQLVNLCENGSYLTRYVFSPQVLDTRILPSTEFYKFYSIAPADGSFVGLPSNLLTSVDKKYNHQSVVFYPKNSSAGDYIYFSSYGSTTSYGKDIFRIQLQADGYWSKPENLGDAVNSNQDDDYPYMSPDGATLYFASKGHYGMGGYDIYKTVYNSVSNKWSTPENLGFPFNSPYDDYLFVVSGNDSLACFTTTRNYMLDTVQLVLVKNESNPIRHSFKTYSELDSISCLNSGPLVLAEGKVKVEEKAVENEVDVLRDQKPASFSSVENDPEYSRVIAKGFAAQMRADSLRVKLEKLREGFDHISTAEERKSLEAKVVKVEDSMLASQREADQMFVRASQIEQEYLTGKRKPAGKGDTTFAADNPKFIYRAQFASTVFRTDEIVRLEQAEQLYPQLEAERDNTIDLMEKYKVCLNNKSDSTQNSCAALHDQMISSMGKYNNLLGKYFDKKHPIYTDCVHVALVKSGSTDAATRDIINLSEAHFRTASTILNNLGDDGQVESTFEASLLRELGLLRLDLAFAKIWRLTLFEQQVTSKIIRLDRIIFGSSQLPNHEASTKSQSVAKAIPEPPKLERTESIKNIQAISFKEEEQNDFRIIDGPFYNAENPIPINSPLPNGVVYRIQVGVYSATLEPSSFKGIVPVYSEKVGRLTKYFVGNFSNLSKAESSLAAAKSKGFKDAFIVAWLNGKTIVPQRAKDLEGTGQLPPVKPTVEESGRIYIVQIGVYDGDLPDDVAKTVKALAPGKDITRNDDARGLKIYSVGNFSSFDEAIRVKDNMVASGIVNAVVVHIDL